MLQKIIQLMKLNVNEDYCKSKFSLHCTYYFLKAECLVFRTKVAQMEDIDMHLVSEISVCLQTNKISKVLKERSFTKSRN